MKPPWTRGQLERLGDAVAGGTPAPATGPTYEDVIQWYANLAAAVQVEIDAIGRTVLSPAGISPRVSARAKSLGTLRDKLGRDHGSKLPTIQDFAGVRLEAPMTLEQQDAVVSAIAERFECEAGQIRDLREGAHSGYRAVHVWLRLEDGRVEVQVRTDLQGAWANAYERLADRIGRDIRYGRLPADPAIRAVVTTLQDVSRVKLRDVEARGLDPMAAQQVVASLQVFEAKVDELPPMPIVEMEP